MLPLRGLDEPRQAMATWEVGQEHFVLEEKLFSPQTMNEKAEYLDFRQRSGARAAFYYDASSGILITARIKGHLLAGHCDRPTAPVGDAFLGFRIQHR